MKQAEKEALVKLLRAHNEQITFKCRHGESAHASWYATFQKRVDDAEREFLAVPHTGD